MGEQIGCLGWHVPHPLSSLASSLHYPSQEEAQKDKTGVVKSTDSPGEPPALVDGA